MKTLTELFERISQALREGQPLSSLQLLIADYQGDDWKQFESYSPITYSRNLVKKNDILEMLVICWNVNQGCGIHDHPEKGCLVKVLQSEVTENVYEMKEIPVMISSDILPAGGIAYKEGSLILHDIFNHSGQPVASLHLYSTPDYKPQYFSHDGKSTVNPQHAFPG